MRAQGEPEEGHPVRPLAHLTRSAPPVRSSLRGGCGRRSPPHSPVEPEEDLLERRLAALELGDARAREHGQQRLELTAEHAAHTVILDLDLFESGDRTDALDRWRLREHYLHPMRSHTRELVELTDRSQVALAHDPNPIAHVLHLGEDMRRDEDRRATDPGIADQPVELLLVERIESARWLVEDEQCRLRRECQEQGQFLLVAVRVLAVLATEVEIETFRDRLHLAVGHVAAEAPDVRHDLGASPAAELRQLARDVANLVLQGHSVAVGVEPEDRCRPSRCVDEAHEELDRRCLSRPVWAEEPEDLALFDVEVEVEDAVTGPVVLCQAMRRDRVCHAELSVFSHFTRPCCTLTVTNVPPPRT